ncbi:malonate decarboxylase holo-ACP synthase [Paraburkholderia phenoliruptrix]|uniref:Phosphoribosyl-dephospho-CoA transferase n=2 Tax=Paraburkholderia phenoliruptrix TaxID=252970 RepID=K0DTI7_9BURK|nr:malonate decarboxylase holo-ACP synthase [Paraburkholderia phenoliruptrix]AFT89551.1 phosphoribosyl-dephospho-CoA transferase [Paraburkholderia phenoliruptrix BR3459a]CAB4051465.1 Phosphoribosyl-dephospho-CoA transferase [Paraburkholderia phenoliruptrix]
MPVCAAPPFACELAVSCDERWRAHDLLRLRRLAAFDGEPAWVRDAFERAPYAVVRRALVAEGIVAIGVRGTGRSQRYGTWAASTDVAEVVSPEALVCSAPPTGRAGLPAFAALAALQRDAGSILNTMVWGPAGSAGFELAARTAAVTPSSDLDLLIRTPQQLSRDCAVDLLTHLQALARETGIRIDAQLETPAGGVALAEWASGKARVMARHASGPRLLADPWSAAHRTAS